MNIEETKQAIAVMQAYLDGKPIEMRNRDLMSQWLSADTSKWNWFNWEYRVKREVVKYRVALMQGECGFYWTNTVNNDAQVENCESHNRFVRWLTDWREVEV